MYIIIAFALVVCTWYKLTHSIWWKNCLQIIFAALNADTFTSTTRIHAVFHEYEVKIPMIVLRYILWHLTVTGQIRRSPKGWRDHNSSYPSPAFSLC